jgi:hypothetical protein
MGRPDASLGVIVGFDHHSDEFNLNEREVNADLRSGCPVAWNEKYGGFWYVSSYDAVEPFGTGAPSATGRSRRGSVAGWSIGALRWPLVQSCPTSSVSVNV